MSLLKMPKLKIGNLEAGLPIIQGGMGVGISLSGLASAVANEGGIGVIAATGIGMLDHADSGNLKEANKWSLAQEIKKARALSKGIIGINIMVACSDYDDLLQVSIDEGADIVFLGAGLPLKFPAGLMADRSRKVKIIPIVSSARATSLIFQYWQKNFGRVPDAVVVEGPLAGGHLGYKKENLDDPSFALEKVLQQVITVVKPYEQQNGMSIPVIAAGGVYTGSDIRKFIQSGAAGVQMATRFVATHECDASIEFKEAYVKSKKEDLTIIDSPVGLPGRAIRNNFIRELAKGIKNPFKCNWKCLKTCDIKSAPYCIGAALTNAKKGLLEKGFAFAGANAYRVDKIVSVKELIAQLLADYELALALEGTS
ncbi:MAG: nitronate monooxygenase [Dehalococcoidia bacterium]|jgi:NAD(P)H-dependent flavin oxidoreductase YrpB (nitropropane dioxygenase family)